MIQDYYIIFSQYNQLDGGAVLAALDEGIYVIRISVPRSHTRIRREGQGKD